MNEKEIYIFGTYPFYDGGYPLFMSFDYEKVKEAFDNEKKEIGYGYHIKKYSLNTPLQFASGKTVKHIEIDYDGKIREWNGEKFVICGEMMIRECINCVHSRGLGSDVWCGHNPRGDESYMFETDCPYFKWVRSNE